MATALKIARIAVGLLFVLIGVLELARHDEFAMRFAHCGVPAPASAATLIGALQLVCGLLLTFAVLTRPAALLLATVMVGATMTAGRIDGGMHLIVPPLLFALCVVLAWRSGRFPAGAPARPPGVQ
jgi:uncharacterized membrane protein YphA (DoxX/SURF4 family)